MMKQNLRLFFLTLLCAVFSTAWGETVTFAAGTDTGEASVTKDGITVSMSTMSRTDNYRTYANSAMTVSSTVGNITSVVITCTGSGTSDYGPGKFSTSSGTYSYSGTTGTWSGSAESVSLSASAQVRITQIVVTYQSSQSGPITTVVTGVPESMTLHEGATSNFTVSSNSTATINVVSNNGEVATVSGSGSNWTVTAEGVGTTTISITQAEVEGQFTAFSTSFTVNVTEAPLLYECVSGYSGTGDSGELSPNSEYLDYGGWSSISKVYASPSGQANGGCLKFGTSSAVGSITTNSINLDTGYGELTFYLKKYGSDSGNLKVTVTDNATINDNGSSVSSVTFTPSSDWTLCTINLENPSGNFTIKFETTSKRAYVDEIILTKTAATGPRDPNVSFASNSVRVGIGATTTNALTKPDDLTVTCSSNNPNVATYDPSTGLVTGVAEGEATITISWDATDEYNSGEKSFDVTVSNILIATYDFRGTYDYGSELTPSTDYVGSSKTWISDGVRLVTAGKYRWFTGTNGNDLRLYKADNDYSDGSITFSLANSNYVITRIEFDSNINGITTVSAGSFNGSVWEGICNTITFTHDGNSGGQTIKTINITYAPTIPVAISEVGYATLYYGTKHLIVPEGVVAYTCKANADHSITHTTTFNSGNIVPAGTAVLLQGTGGNYKFGESANAGNKTVDENMLRGYDTEQETKGPDGTTAGYKFFVLSLNAANQASSVGFYYKEANGAPFTSGAHKAFLAVPNDIAGASSYVFDEQTGISDMKMTTNKEGVYTLSGVRVQNDNLPAGLYIVNGKKMVIK